MARFFLLPRWFLILFLFSNLVSPATAKPSLSAQPFPKTGTESSPNIGRVANGYIRGAEDLPDLDVAFISREPLYKAYCVEYTNGIPALCPGTEDWKHWPEPGEVVTFTAYIDNMGTAASPAFDFEWRIDDTPVATGTLLSLSPGEGTYATYRWPWGHNMDGERVLDDHTMRFIADPENKVVEGYESNNSLEEYTNALSFSIYITPEMFDAYNTPVDPSLPWSAYDWLQKQIAAMNQVFASSIYPVTPGGATPRVRINKIKVLPSDPGYDFSHDGGWFVNADYRHGASAYYDPATDIDWGLVHELTHQVGLIDLYASNIYATNVFVKDRLGRPANFGFEWPRPDLMGGGDIAPHTDPNLYSSHTAGGFSSNYGYRNGYYGVYQYDIPQQNYLRILDSQGNPASGVQVALFQRQGPIDWTGHVGVDNTPEITGTTSVDGRFLLPNRSANGGTVTRSGHVLRDNPFGVIDIIGVRNRFLLRLSQGTHEEFHWMDVTDFNLAYWLGDTISHTFTIPSHVPPAGALQPPVISSFRVEGNLVTLCWQPVPGDVAGYRVYRASPPDHLYQAASDLIPGTCYEDNLAYSASSHFSAEVRSPSSPGYGGSTYAVVAVGATGRESGFSDTAWAPSLVNPASVALMPGGERLILDPQNGYAIIRQGKNGRYIDNIGSVHYTLENSRFLALDPNNRLIFSHPGDWYDGRHSVRVASANLTPLL